MIRTGVLGAAGRMGRLVSGAVADDPDLELVAAVDPSHAGQRLGETIGRPDVDIVISDRLDVLEDAAAEVAVDFTQPTSVMENVRWTLERGMHLVVGTTGVGPEQLAEIEETLEARGHHSNVIVAPNFSVGAALLQRFAEQAARFFPAAEVIELHHEAKADAPSGTSLATAQRMSSARPVEWRGPSAESIPGARGAEEDGIRIHSVRLPGLVAHQEVIFGDLGQTLTIRHDSLDRTSFMPGVVMAIKAVLHRPGLTIGVEPLLSFYSDAPS